MMKAWISMSNRVTKLETKFDCFADTQTRDVNNLGKIVRAAVTHKTKEKQR